MQLQRTAAAAAESVLGVVVGKGCLKQLGGSASDGTSVASKKVRFALDETSEVKGQRQRSQVILSVSGRVRLQKRNDGGGGAHESVTGEVGADAPMTQSRMKVVCLHAPIEVESQNNPAEAEEGGEVVGTATGRKQKRKAEENAEVIADSRAGISHRITRSLSSSAAAVLLPLDVEEKRGARKVGDGNDELSTEENAAGVQDLTIAASLVIIESSSSRKGGDCIPSVQKPSKVVVSSRTTRLSSVAADVPTVIGKKRRKTRGRPKARKTLPTATLGGSGSQQKCDVGGNSVDHGAFREVCADVPVTQSVTKAVNSCSESGVKSQNNLAEAEEEEEAVEASTYRKQKRKIQKSSDDISANALPGISLRRMRKSGSSTSAVLLSSVCEKMEEVDDKDELGVKELAEAKVLPTTALPIIGESRSKRKEEDYAPAELKPAKEKFYGRTTRAHSTAPAVLLPIVIGSKVRKTKDVQPNGDESRDLEVLQNALDETHVREKLEIKRKPSRPATHRHQPIVPSVEEKQQVVVPCKFFQHRRSSRNHPQADELLRNTNLENNKLSRVPVGGKDLSIAHRLTHDTAKTSMEDVESLSSGFKDSITRSYKDNIAINGGRVSLSDDSGNKDSAAETALGV